MAPPPLVESKVVQELGARVITKNKRGFFSLMWKEKKG
jgi:hypothetical protein